ncbi:MAG: MBL fold metallo-hydrolase [Anaerotignaceae bacterium]
MIKLKKIKLVLLALMLFCVTACSAGVQSGLADTTQQSNGQLVVHYIDVGQADCTLIMLPTGENVLVDAGNREDKDYILNYLNNLDITHIDAAIATHPHEDHIGAMQYVLANYDVDRLLMPDFDIDTNVYTNMLYAMEENDVEEIRVTEPFDMEIGGIPFEFLAPVAWYSDANNNSIVFKMTYGEKTFLFTGDIEKEAERDILNSGADVSADVLKVAHHGSNTSSTTDFLAEVNPELAIIQVGTDNDYGLPNEDALKRFSNVEVLRTDFHGDIVVKCDGEKITTFCSSTESKSLIDVKPQLTIAAGNTFSENKEVTPDKTATVDSAESITYIGNKNSLVFHLPDCKSLPAEKNRVYFDDKESAISAGFHPCGVCQK